MRFIEKSEEGAVITLFAFLILPLLTLASFVLDVGRQSYINTQLAYACDAAAVAAARYDINDAVANATKVFYANYPPSNVNLSVTPIVTLSTNNRIITVSVTSQMPTVLGGIADIFKLGVGAVTQVNRYFKNNEIALVLDVTGSMSSNNKIQGLRDASTQLIDIIYESQKSIEGMAISIVPYVASVNIGNSYRSWVKISNTLNPKNNLTIDTLFPTGEPWKGCVGAVDTGSVMDSDAPPSATRKWPVYFAQSTVGLVTSPGDNDWSVNSNGTVRVVTSNSGATVGPNRSCGPAIMPLTNDSVALKAKINTLQPVNGGGTFGNLGLVWGWNTISPKWSGLWNSTIQALPYGSDTIKSIVIVTDGENQWYDQPGYNPIGDPTAYGFEASTNRLSANRLGTTSISQSRTFIDNRLLDLCQKIKAQGIQIFTVTFQVSDTRAKDIYRTCATKPEWSFQADNSTQLYDQFTQIARQLKKINIIK